MPEPQKNPSAGRSGLWLRRTEDSRTFQMTDQYADQSLVPQRPEPKTRSGRRRKGIRVHGPAVPTGPSPASKALEKAIRWQKVIESEGITRAEVARREGCTRARVTQLMKLLTLEESLKERLLTADADLTGWTIRRAIREASQSHSSES